MKKIQPIWTFMKGSASGDASMKELLGGKGANLQEMAGLGMNVPPGYTITTTVCGQFMAGGYKAVEPVVDRAIELYFDLKSVMGLDYDPLVSCRSGARVSMPGMMDTVLNIGLTSKTLPGWSERVGERTALDCYRRLIQMMGNVVCDIPHEVWDHILTKHKTAAGVTEDKDLTAEHLKAVVADYLKFFKALAGFEFWDKVEDQLRAAICAVFTSWNNDRAVAYREMHGYSHDWGTACTIQAMVFGNLNDQSCTGVYFTRCPSTGEPNMTGEFLVNAQGEDVVAGIRTPEPIWSPEGPGPMAAWNKWVAEELVVVGERLEQHYGDMMDIEFTVQNGELFILQARSGKRSAKAAFRIAEDMVAHGQLTLAEARKRLSAAQFLSLIGRQIDPSFAGKPDAKGIAAGGGVVTGAVAKSAERAVEMASSGQPVILVSHETTPDDIKGMAASVGILTTTGGLTSHAAVVARGMDKVCVVGCSGLDIEKMAEGSIVSICGSTGRVWFSAVPVVTLTPSEFAMSFLTNAVTAGKALHGTTVDGTMFLSAIDINESTTVPEGVKRVVLDVSSTAYPEIGFNLDSVVREVFSIEGGSNLPAPVAKVAGSVEVVTVGGRCHGAVEAGPAKTVKALVEGTGFLTPEVVETLFGSAEVMMAVREALGFKSLILPTSLSDAAQVAFTKE